MGTEPGVSSLLQFVPAILIFMVFYFLVIKPRNEKQGEQKKMLEGVKKNDQIVTSSGIHGTVVQVKEKTVLVRIDENVRIELDKEAIATITKSTT
ncbi:MAG: preprotein translocase subunit YajC [Omnitrophica WOR_2 bacterium GWA2_47_8]|nr:MAG: preprotein translocase subunit YajC [Omnitrophica WOR_2 bacterium GWA2_47_8]